MSHIESNLTRRQRPTWVVMLGLCFALSACTTGPSVDGQDAALGDSASFEVVGGGGGGGGATVRYPQPGQGACAGDVECVGVFGALAPCSASRCNLSTGICELRPQIDGVACDDGDGCTRLDVCTSGECLGAPVNCDDANPCTNDSCDLSTGLCAHAPRLGSCDDGNLCTVEDTCTGGVCTGPPNAICTCNVDGDCAQFDDGDLCNGTLFCDGDNTCWGTELCDPEVGWVDCTATVPALSTNAGSRLAKIAAQSLKHLPS